MLYNYRICECCQNRPLFSGSTRSSFFSDGESSSSFRRSVLMRAQNRNEGGTQLYRTSASHNAHHWLPQIGCAAWNLNQYQIRAIGRPFPEKLILSSERLPPTDLSRLTRYEDTSQQKSPTSALTLARARRVLCYKRSLFPWQSSWTNCSKRRGNG